MAIVNINNIMLFYFTFVAGALSPDYTWHTLNPLYIHNKEYKIHYIINNLRQVTDYENIEYSEAMERCQVEYDQLAIIEDDYINSQLNYQMQKAIRLFLDGPPTLKIGAYFGLTQNNEYGVDQIWQYWIDGSMVNYTNWKNPPENSTIRTCSVMRLDGKWQQDFCDSQIRENTNSNSRSRLMFICEKELPGCEVLDNCHPNAECVIDTQSTKYMCRCRPGYHGDGNLRCNPVEATTRTDTIKHSATTRTDTIKHSAPTRTDTIKTSAPARTDAIKPSGAASQFVTTVVAFVTASVLVAMVLM